MRCASCLAVLSILCVASAIGADGRDDDGDDDDAGGWPMSSGPSIADGRIYIGLGDTFQVGFTGPGAIVALGL